MPQADCVDRIDLVNLCKDYGATNFRETMYEAALKGHIEIVILCRGWLGFNRLHQELFRHHHKRKSFRRIHDVVLPIACHPDRFLDWCLDEEEKGFLKGVWRDI